MHQNLLFMELSKIMTISGKSGLFVVVSQAKTSVIVESLIDKKRFPVFTTDKMSMLSDINIILEDGDIQLVEVFKKIFEKEGGKLTIDHKADDKALKSYFEEVLPNYNKEKVYASDIRKVISWFNLLQQNNLIEEILKNEAEKEKEANNSDEVTVEQDGTEDQAKENKVKAEKGEESQEPAPKKVKSTTTVKAAKTKNSMNISPKDSDVKPKTKTAKTTKTTKKPTAK